MRTTRDADGRLSEPSAAHGQRTWADHAAAILRVRPTDAWDIVVAADPGLTRLVMALEAALGISVVLAVEYGFAQLAHPFWATAPGSSPMSPATAAALGAQHHALTIVLMLLGGLFTMISSIAVSDVRPRAQAITLLGAPVAMLPAIAVAIALSGHHWIAIAGLTLVVGVGTWVRRFGPRYFYWGSLGFLGYFFGVLAGPELPLSRFYWLAVALALAAVVNLALRVAVFNPVAAGGTERGRASFGARARRVIAAAADVLGDGGGSSDGVRLRRRLEAQLTRLNESALMFDGQLADPRARLTPDAAQHLHEQLFDLELGLDNLARITASLAGMELPAAARAEIRAWLLELHDGDTAPAAAWDARETTGSSPDPATASLPGPARDLSYAVAVLTVEVGERLNEWTHPTPPAEPSLGAGLLTELYESPVSLFGGFLAGSRVASRDATALSGGQGLAARLRLDSVSQSAIRVMVAVGVASSLASLISEHRFYWAAISSFIAFLGANTAGEQVIKAGARVSGTVLGILIGSLLASAIGDSTWSLAVILPAVTLGIYFQRVSYSLMATGITIMIAMLYVLLGEFSHSLLELRLELTALGAVIAMLAALLILPVSTQQVTRVATVAYLITLRDLLAAMPGSLAGASAMRELTRESRAMDDALTQTLTSARPLAREPFRHRALQHNLVLLSSSAHWARNLVATVALIDDVDDGYWERVGAAAQGESEAVDELAKAMRGHSSPDRASGAPPDPAGASARRPPLEEVAEMGRRLTESGVRHSDPRRRLLRHLLALDGTLVRLSHNLGGAATPDGA